MSLVTGFLKSVLMIESIRGVWIDYFKFLLCTRTFATCLNLLFNLFEEGTVSSIFIEEKMET